MQTALALPNAALIHLVTTWYQSSFLQFIAINDTTLIGRILSNSPKLFCLLLISHKILDCYITSLAMYIAPVTIGAGIKMTLLLYLDITVFSKRLKMAINVTLLVKLVHTSSLLLIKHYQELSSATKWHKRMLNWLI